MLQTRFKIFFWILIVIIVSFSTYLMVDMCWAKYHLHKYPFMAGKTGSMCYPSENGHGNIRYHMYFVNLESCLEYVKINR